MAHTKRPSLTQRPSIQRESHMVLNGRRMRRCQALKSDGSRQCRQPARQGFEVCQKHGAGTRKRVEAGTRKAAGRPLEHGLYSKNARSLADLQAELLANQHELALTDQEMAANKAIFLTLLRLMPSITELAQALQDALDEGKAMTVEEKAEVLKQALRAERMMLRLHEVAGKNIYQAKLRADTDVKRANDVALEMIASTVPTIRRILLDMLDYEQYEVFYERFRREVIAAQGLKLEDDEDLPN